MSIDCIGERRKEARSRQLKSGSIVLNGASSVLTCAVRNISQAGACLMVPSPLIVPPAFDLLVGAERRHCTVAWRLPDRIGVKYQ
jgi:hypothetical protein